MADSAAAAESLKSSGKRGMIGGVVAAGIGIGISAATYQSAAIGGSYIFAWGPILLGLVTFFRGLMQYTKGANMARRVATSPAPAQPAYPQSPVYPAHPGYAQAQYPSQPVPQPAPGPAPYPAYPPAQPPPPPQWPTAQPSPAPPPPPPAWPGSGGPPRTPPERAR